MSSMNVGSASIEFIKFIHFPIWINVIYSNLLSILWSISFLIWYLRLNEESEEWDGILHEHLNTEHIIQIVENSMSHLCRTFFHPWITMRVMISFFFLLYLYQIHLCVLSAIFLWISWIVFFYLHTKSRFGIQTETKEEFWNPLKNIVVTHWDAKTKNMHETK